MTILIPSYKPDIHMVDTVRELKEAAGDARILVVDDGGGEEYAPFFAQAEEAGAVVLKHDVNRGKGAALKTGFAWLIENGETEGCVTADADGQHLTKDILKVAEKVRQFPNALIIGGRKFNRPGVPPRSKAGNYATRFTYNLLCGQCIGDTQTGLRGVPASLFKDMIAIPGDRYEYEMRQLLCARQMDVELVETEIDTVYLDIENSASHFNPLKDAMRVYVPVIAAGLGLILSVICDIVLFLLLFPKMGLIGAAFAARGGAFAVRSIDLLIRRRGRRLKLSKVLDFVLFTLFSITFSAFFAHFLSGIVTFITPVMLKLIGELIIIVYICLLKAIKIRRVK